MRHRRASEAGRWHIVADGTGRDGAGLRLAGLAGMAGGGYPAGRRIFVVGRPGKSSAIGELAAG